MIQSKNDYVYKFNVKSKTQVQTCWKCGVCMWKIMSNFMKICFLAFQKEKDRKSCKSEK